MNLRFWCTAKYLQDASCPGRPHAAARQLKCTGRRLVQFPPSALCLFVRHGAGVSEPVTSDLLQLNFRLAHYYRPVL
jgi:hypothetical protein